MIKDSHQPEPEDGIGSAAAVGDYCREIETYLCRKNDGHLIRVVGPSFELVSRWAHDGVPLKVACAGIDRYFERYYAKGPRRRPVRIDFCEADVLDVFDEWRRATGLTATPTAPDASAGDPRRGPSLPDHLERVLMRLTNLQVAGTVDAEFDPLIEQVSRALDRARSARGGLRGDARRELIESLGGLDEALMQVARRRIAADDLAALRREASAVLGPIANQMAPEARERAIDRALDELIRVRRRLPTIAFS